MTLTTQAQTTPRPTLNHRAVPVGVQTALSLSSGLLTTGLLAFGLKVLSNQDFWASGLLLLLPELALISIMLVASIMSLSQSLKVAKQFKTGQVNEVATVNMHSWAMMAVFSAMTQIAWAGMIYATNGCHI